MEILASTNQRWFKNRLRSPLTLEPTATLVCYMAYSVRFLRSNAQYMLSCLKFDGELVSFIKVAFSSSLKNHQYVKNLNKVLTLLSRAGVTLILPKCHLFQQDFECLDNMLMPGRLAAASKNVYAMKTSIVPSDSTQTR